MCDVWDNLGIEAHGLSSDTVFGRLSACNKLKLPGRDQSGYPPKIASFDIQKGGLLGLALTAVINGSQLGSEPHSKPSRYG